MSLRINTNIDALTAYRNLSTTQSSMSQSIARLSSGLRINKAADDAAGLAISQGLTAQINGIGQALRNAQDGINVVQTADGALNETQSILQRMRTLSVQAANDSNDTASRNDINTEITALQSELDKISTNTTFNNIKLLDGTFTTQHFQVGYAAGDTLDVSITGPASAANSTFSAAAWDGTSDMQFTYGGADITVTAAQLTAAGLTATSTAGDIGAALNNNSAFAGAFNASVDSNGVLTVAAKAYDASDADNKITVAGVGGTETDNAYTAGAGGLGAVGLGVDAGKVNLSTQAGAQSAITALDGAIQSVSTVRANLGALQNQFQHHINNLSVTQENLQASNSAITDTDMAAEMSNYTRTQILSQAGTAMLKQANQAAQSVLALLQ